MNKRAKVVESKTITRLWSNEIATSLSSLYLHPPRELRLLMSELVYNLERQKLKNRCLDWVRWYNVLTRIVEGLTCRRAVRIGSKIRGERSTGHREGCDW
jgi:hypothetical protein